MAAPRTYATCIRCDQGAHAGVAVEALTPDFQGVCATSSGVVDSV